ncbi:MAG: hypothetical protein HOJ88_11695 [Proteobacteria bacterium]|nr:hypothetical protein [Pseudomonadota bacterium]
MGLKPSITNSYRYSYHSGSTTGYVTGKSGDGIDDTGSEGVLVGLKGTPENNKSSGWSLVVRGVKNGGPRRT